jgi:hypothetical protein
MKPNKVIRFEYICKISATKVRGKNKVKTAGGSAGSRNKNPFRGQGVLREAGIKIPSGGRGFCGIYL